MTVSEEEVSDIVQDAYVKISNLESVAHIKSGRGYFFATARTILLDRIRRDRIVRIDSMTEMQELTLADDDPGPSAGSARGWSWNACRRLIAALPSRCREIFELRAHSGRPAK